MQIKHERNECHCLPFYKANNFKLHVMKIIKRRCKVVVWENVCLKRISNRLTLLLFLVLKYFELWHFVDSVNFLDFFWTLLLMEKWTDTQTEVISHLPLRTGNVIKIHQTLSQPFNNYYMRYSDFTFAALILGLIVHRLVCFNT